MKAQTGNINIRMNVRVIQWMLREPLYGSFWFKGLLDFEIQSRNSSNYVRSVKKF
jgi:hypothetical protein